MTLDEAISMEPIKQKLRNLREHMPDCEQITYDFGAYLAERLEPQLSPGRFASVTVHMIDDLSVGSDGDTQQRINNNLTGYPPDRYRALRKQVPEIAQAVCPADFAAKVKAFYE